jgi:3-amino-5-hydroxybenzoate synthase
MISAPLPEWPPADDRQRAALLDVLESGDWWSRGGTVVSRFEQAFANAHGAEAGIACTNGTHALELALRALDVGPGDEVIVPAMTFAASSMAVMLVGALPIPVDVDRDSWCIDVEAARAALSPRTRAIMPVHFAGRMADIPALCAFARTHGIAVIEDAAHAHGARLGDSAAGSFGDFAAFSFQSFKLMTAGEGGMLLANNSALAERARLIAHCGRPEGDRAYRHEVLGSNMRMTEFQAAILHAQLDRLEERAELRTRRAMRLRAGLRTMNAVRLQEINERHERHAWYMVVAMLPEEGFNGLDRDMLVSALVAEGVPAYRLYPPVQMLEHFDGDFRRLGGDPRALPETPVSAALGERGLWLHHRILLGDERLVDQVCACFEKLSRGSDAIRAICGG